MSVFTKIIAGEIPGRFVWADEVCVAFATIEPQVPGHVLVVPRAEVESLIDADEALVAHLAVVSQRIAATQVRVFEAVRPGIMVVGLDVPHLHIHVLPLHSSADMALSVARAVPGEELDTAMELLRTGLVDDGWGQFVPESMGSAATGLAAAAGTAVSV
ncbi:HIT family protein [Actinomyces trachealis]|uniref:HIT family protein n=1 Tax=Actinomyces trachealis TaxID=2763540 RepID=UPI0018928A26|nr:HIT family protein [Actinomyces trachealis]